MPTNVQVKVRIRGDKSHLRKRAADLAGCTPTRFRQEDTFFRTQRGRLKLRVFDTGQAELIYYEQPDEPGPRLSTYIIAGVDDPAALKTLLAAALGVRGTVRKQRELYLAGDTRIHIDDVEGLGSFLELEVALPGGNSCAASSHKCLEMMHRLGLGRSDLLECAYVDLLERRAPLQP